MGLFDILAGPVKGLFDSLVGAADEFITSGEEKQQFKLKMAELETEFSLTMATNLKHVIQRQADVIMSEAGGESWLQRAWRPITMLTFLAIIVYQSIGISALAAIGLTVPHIDMTAIPPKMWNLLTLGIGGYIGGRSLEKVAKSWRNGNGAPKR